MHIGRRRLREAIFFGAYFQESLWRRGWGNLWKRRMHIVSRRLREAIFFNSFAGDRVSRRIWGNPCKWRDAHCEAEACRGVVCDVWDVIIWGEVFFLCQQEWSGVIFTVVSLTRSSLASSLCFKNRVNWGAGFLQNFETCVWEIHRLERYEDSDGFTASGTAEIISFQVHLIQIY